MDENDIKINIIPAKHKDRPHNMSRLVKVTHTPSGIAVTRSVQYSQTLTCVAAKEELKQLVKDWEE